MNPRLTNSAQGLGTAPSVPSTAIAVAAGRPLMTAVTEPTNHRMTPIELRAVAIEIGQGHGSSLGSTNRAYG